MLRLTRSQHRSFYFQIRALTGSQMHNYNYKLNHLINQHNYHEAFKMVGEMEKRGIPLEQPTYNHLLRMHCDQNTLEDMERTLEEMKEKGFKPSVIQMNAMLHACARNEDGSRLNQLFQEMDNMSIAKDENTYLEMIRYHSAQGHLDECHALLDKMTGEGLEPTLEIYTDLIYSYTKSGHVKEALRIYERSRQHHVAPTSVYLNLMLEVAIKARDTRLIHDLLDQMYQHHFDSHPMAYQALKELEARQ